MVDPTHVQVLHTIGPEGLQVNLIESKINELLTLTSIISPAFDSLIPP